MKWVHIILLNFLLSRVTNLLLLYCYLPHCMSVFLSVRVFGNQHITEFRDNLNKVFDAFGRILQGSGEELADAQVR